MNIPDYKHEQNQKDAKELTALGYSLEVSANGYFVRFKGAGLGGASVQLPRRKPLHWRHREANLRDNLQSAVSKAKQHAQANREVVFR